MAVVEIAWERYDDAKPHLAKALSLLPGDPRALYSRALVERNAGPGDVIYVLAEQGWFAWYGHDDLRERAAMRDGVVLAPPPAIDAPGTSPFTLWVVATRTWEVDPHGATLRCLSSLGTDEPTVNRHLVSVQPIRVDDPTHADARFAACLAGVAS